MAEQSGEERAAVTVNVVAEASLLSAVLTDPALFDDIDGRLSAQDFVHPLHFAVFEAIVNADAQGRPLDTVSIADEMRRSGTLDKFGGMETLENLRCADHSGDVLDDTVTMLRDHSLRRRLYTAGGQIRSDARREDLDPQTLSGNAEQAIFAAVSGGVHTATWTPMPAVIAEVHTRMATTRTTHLVGTSTGIEELDRYTGGFSPGQFILIGGRPGSGKSVLALQIAAHIAATTDAAVPFLSYEMSCDELGFRLLAAATGIDMQSLQRGVIPEGMGHLAVREAERLASLPLLIDDTPPRTISGVRSAVRRLARRREISAVVIDYLQLMGTDRPHEGRTQEIGEISREGKLLASELGVPVIACSQLSRQLMNRVDKRPQLSDLRESGCMPGYTKLQLADGTTVSFSDLLRNGWDNVSVCSVENNRTVGSTLTNVFSSGTKLVYRLRTGGGREVHASANHKFLTPSGWVRLDKLSVGDSVASVKQGVSIGAPVLWDRVFSIVEQGLMEVFDATVDTTANFVADGLVAHNSLEQDSNVVLFVHREHVFNDQAPADAAELIIGKNRNGPAPATVHLRWDGGAMRFRPWPGGAGPGVGGPRFADDFF